MVVDGVHWSTFSQKNRELLIAASLCTKLQLISLPEISKKGNQSKQWYLGPYAISWEQASLNRWSTLWLGGISKSYFVYCFQAVGFTNRIIKMFVAMEALKNLDPLSLLEELEEGEEGEKGKYYLRLDKIIAERDTSVPAAEKRCIFKMEGDSELHFGYSTFYQDKSEIFLVVHPNHWGPFQKRFRDICELVDTTIQSLMELKLNEFEDENALKVLGEDAKLLTAGLGNALMLPDGPGGILYSYAVANLTSSAYMGPSWAQSSYGNFVLGGAAISTSLLFGFFSGIIDNITERLSGDYLRNIGTGEAKHHAVFNIAREKETKEKKETKEEKETKPEEHNEITFTKENFQKLMGENFVYNMPLFEPGRDFVFNENFPNMMVSDYFICYVAQNKRSKVYPLFVHKYALQEVKHEKIKNPIFGQSGQIVIGKKGQLEKVYHYSEDIQEKILAKEQALEGNDPKKIARANFDVYESVIKEVKKRLSPLKKVSEEEKITDNFPDLDLAKTSTLPIVTILREKCDLLDPAKNSDEEESAKKSAKKYIKEIFKHNIKEAANGFEEQECGLFFGYEGVFGEKSGKLFFAILPYNLHDKSNGTEHMDTYYQHTFGIPCAAAKEKLHKFGISSRSWYLDFFDEELTKRRENDGIKKAHLKLAMAAFSGIVSSVFTETGRKALDIKQKVLDNVPGLGHARKGLSKVPLLKETVKDRSDKLRFIGFTAHDPAEIV